MTNPVDPPDVIIEDNVVGKLRYTMDDEGRVHVSGVPGIGQAVMDALSRNGYRVIMVDRNRRIVRKT